MVSAEFQGVPARMGLGLLITQAPALTVNLVDTRLGHIRQPVAMASQGFSADLRRLSNVS
jgi:hypothetical protein